MSSGYNLNTVNGFLMELGYQSAVIAGLELLGVTDAIVKPTDNDIVRSLKLGVIWAGCDELVLWLETGKSYLISGNYYYVVDDAFFNSSIWYGLSVSGLGEKVTAPIDNNLPFSNDINSSIAGGVLKVSAKMLQQYILTNYSTSILGKLVQPTLALGLHS